MSINNQVDKQWYIHTVEHYTAVRIIELLPMTTEMKLNVELKNP